MLFVLESLVIVAAGLLMIFAKLGSGKRRCSRKSEEEQCDGTVDLNNGHDGRKMSSCLFVSFEYLDL